MSVLFFDIDLSNRSMTASATTAGDAVIRHVATCAAATRRAAILARIGGEEFALLLPEPAASGDSPRRRNASAAEASAFEIDGPGSE